MSEPSPIRFFWTVCRPPQSAAAVAALLFAYGLFLARRNPNDFHDVVGLALIGQMLAASTGYRDRLARGHFDPILAGRRSRVGIAIAHAGLSIVPGLLFWIAIGALEALTPARRLTVLSPGGITAIVHISVAVWTISLALGRNTGGVLWIVTLFLLAAGHQLTALQEAYGTSSAEIAVSVRAARAALVWPVALLTNGGYVEPPVLTLVAIAIVLMFAAGVAIVVWLDAP
ncbi:MAG TPA: hypothetical protein VGY57_10875, partial [Vicinamibacterales bacterium]|nr:hypothetical protein [Vicinamibacterales bacterium]